MATAWSGRLFSRFVGVVSAVVSLMMMLAVSLSAVSVVVVAASAAASSVGRRSPPFSQHRGKLCSLKLLLSSVHSITRLPSFSAGTVLGIKAGGGHYTHPPPTPTTGKKEVKEEEEEVKEEEEDAANKQNYIVGARLIVDASQQFAADSAPALGKAAAEASVPLAQSIKKAAAKASVPLAQSIEKGLSSVGTGLSSLGVFYLVGVVLCLPSERWKESGRLLTSCTKHSSKIFFGIAATLVAVLVVPVAIARVTSLRWWGGGGGGTSSQRNNEYDDDSSHGSYE
jgi:hypothetical protein